MPIFTSTDQLSASTGSSLIGYGSTTVQDMLNSDNLSSYASLRSYTGTNNNVTISGYGSSASPWIGGIFTYDPTDTTTVDDGGTVIVDSSNRRWKRQFSGAASINWWGADPTGTNDSTTAVQAAFNWLNGANYRTLSGAVGATYKLNSTITFTGKNCMFDGNSCNFSITTGTTTRAPIFLLNNTNSTYLTMKNFVINTTSNYNGHAISIVGTGQSPQVIILDNIRTYNLYGTSYDYTGTNPIPTCHVYAYGIYTLDINNCGFLGGSQGILVDTCQKVIVTKTTIGNCTNQGVSFLNSSNVAVDQRSIISQCGTTGQGAFYFNNCQNVSYRNSRIKQAGGSLIKSGDTSNQNVLISNNFLDHYSTTDDALLLSTSCVALSVDSNTVQFVGQGVAYTNGISLVDTSTGGSIGMCPRIVGNFIYVGGTDSLVSAININSTLNSWRSCVIQNNNIGGYGTNSTITNGINLVGNGSNSLIKSNNIGNNGGTVTNGTVIGSGQSSTEYLSNTYNAAPTNILVDNGVLTRSYVSGSFTATCSGWSTTPTTTCVYERQGRSVTMKILGFTATSNGTGFLLSGLPSVIQPASNQYCIVNVIDNNIAAFGTVLLTQSTSMTFSNGPVGGTFTASGTKGLNATTITWQM